MHFVMHRMMGRSCHGASEPDEGAQPVEIGDAESVAIARPQTNSEVR
jgi:hypothetical protein